MELREKLRYAGVTTEAAPGRPFVASRDWDVLPDVDLRCVETALGDVYVCEKRWPLEHYHGHRALGEALQVDSRAVARLAPGLCGEDVARTVFLDVETTGLAGGTGTLVFLVGLGAFDGDARTGARLGDFLVRQFFLAGPSGEEAMLVAVVEALSPAAALVSFNGRCFDLPLLETRLTLNRLRPPSPSAPHLDLLYPARRLYRCRLESCRLAHLETALLGLEREDDVPGWLIPSLYFNYLRLGQAAPLEAVFRHNALDILSMVTLLAHLGDVVGGNGARDAADFVALARWDEAEGRATEALALYEAALHCDGDEQQRMVAVRALKRVYRREARWSETAAMLESVAEGHAAAEHRLEALVALAKLMEHQQRRLDEAESLTRRALTLVEVAEARGRLPDAALSREALLHRLSRLRRRLAASDDAHLSAGRQM
jgi:uncharacterized protein YprB with RNaseH-like and TPR domain